MLKINDVVVTPTIFPDKTSQVWRLPDELLDAVYRDNSAEVTWEFESEAEISHLAQIKHLLNTFCDRVVLTMPYLPYGRQDKWVDNEATFALRSFAGLLNSMRFDVVSVLDAHNIKRARLIENIINQSPRDFIIAAANETRANVLLFPDSGAYERYGQYRIAKSAYATKDRDQATGAIRSIKINGDLAGKRVLIVDDICDGGATFVWLAKAASEAKEINLYVTHGIFSKGLAPLREAGIKRIFTHKGEIK